MPLDAMSDESDEALLMRYAAGDEAAAQALTLRLTPRVYAHACRMLGIPAEAEDVTQEALMRLWRIAPEWRRGEAQVTTWLFRVVANLCTDRLRRARGVALDERPGTGGRPGKCRRTDAGAKPGRGVAGGIGPVA